MTYPEFLECMAVLALGVGKNMPANQADVWFQVLGDLTAEQLKQAVVRSLREHKFAGFPPMGVLREYAGASTSPVAITDRAVVAWDRVVDAIKRHGGYRTVDFDDACINAAVRTLGGWNSLCETETHELHAFVRQRFAEAYKAHAAAGVFEHQAEPLPGLLAADAALFGYADPDPVDIATGLPVSQVKRLGESRPRGLPSPEVARAITGALVKTVDLSDFEKPKPPPHKLVGTAAEQAAELRRRFGDA